MLSLIIVYMLSNWGASIWLKVLVIPILSCVAGFVASVISVGDPGSFAIAVSSTITVFILTSVFYPFFRKKFKHKSRSIEEVEESRRFIKSNFK
jgi:hypothetical protein